MMHQIKDNNLLEQTLPLRSLNDFLHLLDKDQSSALEASFSVVYYHYLMIKEVIQINEPLHNFLNLQ